jgi:hypothetical protein
VFYQIPQGGFVDIVGHICNFSNLIYVSSDLTDLVCNLQKRESINRKKITICHRPDEKITVALNVGLGFLFIYKFLFIFRKSEGNPIISLLHFCIPSFIIFCINFCRAKQGLGEYPQIDFKALP